MNGTCIYVDYSLRYDFYIRQTPCIVSYIKSAIVIYEYHNNDLQNSINIKHKCRLQVYDCLLLSLNAQSYFTNMEELMQMQRTIVSFPL